MLSTYGSNHEEQQFKRWRQEVQDLLGRIASQGYNANATTLANRMFRSMSQRGDSLPKFRRDMGDTLNEMKIIVQNYEKYGDPKAELEDEPTPFFGSPLEHAPAVAVGLQPGGGLRLAFLSPCCRPRRSPLHGSFTK